MTKPQDIVAEIEALPMFRKSTTVGYQEWDWVHRPTVLALVRAALVRTPETLDGTTTDCPLAGVHEHAFRGPHRFHEWDPADYASPAPDPGAVELCPECVGTGYVRHSGDMHFQVAPSAEPPETA